MRIAGFTVRPLTALLVFVPVSVVLEILHAPAPWIFAASALAIVPLAGLLGEATEHLSVRLGAGLGGFLNATFGNAAELIIAFIALRQGLTEVVKASLTGSIIGNSLLVLGAALVVGGLRHRRLSFNPTAAGIGSTLLALSVIGLVVPAGRGAIAPQADLVGSRGVLVGSMRGTVKHEHLAAVTNHKRPIISSSTGNHGQS